MVRTLETLVIKNPSPKAVKLLEKMRKYKMEQLEKMRNLTQYDYEIKIR